MNKDRVPYTNLLSVLDKWKISDHLTRDHVKTHLSRLASSEHDEWRRLPGQMFWPPRIVNAVQKDSLTVFFGSGISIAAGIPDWIGLLRQVGLDADVERDPSVSGDLLTLAELAAHLIGFDPLQTTLRQAITEKKQDPTTAHFLLAALYLPLYLTTNYDYLFEDAFATVHTVEATVITNDLDVRSHLGDAPASWDKALKNKITGCFVIKLHGCVKRSDEHLILTRSDYRRHYRSNPLMLELVKHLLGTRHTLFLGFSHRDPEVSRIIEDVIFAAEKASLSIPGFYSLQFGMLQKTPEVFAARGIVALQPPLVLSISSASDVRGCALSQGLSDLFENSDSKMDEVLSLDDHLRNVAGEISNELQTLLGRFNIHINNALVALKNHDDGLAQSTTDALLSLGEFANQGVYLVDQYGRITAASCPSGLDAIQRKKNAKSFLERPYFRLAKSNRESFVSNIFESIFNRNATLAACIPLYDSGTFRGLLFSAFQLNESGFAQRVRSLAIPNGASLLVTDANGVVVIPVTNDLKVRTLKPKDLMISTEDASANIGFSYWELLQLSRQDKRIDRLMQNVVPLSQDDDVYTLANDTVSYSVVTELKKARWKVALTRFLRIRN